MYRDDGLDAQLGRFLDHPFEALELDERHEQGDADDGLGDGQLFHDAESNGTLARFHDLGEIEARAVADLVLLAGLRAQDAGEMLGLFAVKLSFTAPHLVHKETSPGHNGRMLDVGCWML